MHGQDKYYLVVKEDGYRFRQGLYEIKNIALRFDEGYSSFKKNSDEVGTGLYVWLVEVNGNANSYKISEDDLLKITEYEQINSKPSYLSNLSHSQYISAIDSLNRIKAHFLPAVNGIYESISYSIRFRFKFGGNFDSTNYQSRIHTLMTQKSAMSEDIKELLELAKYNPHNIDSIQNLQKKLGIIKEELALLQIYPELSGWNYETIKGEINARSEALFSKIQKRKFWHKHIQNYYIWYDTESLLMTFMCNENNLNLIKKYEIDLKKRSSIEVIGSDYNPINKLIIVY